MNALERIRRQGFKLAPAGNDDLYVEPIDALTDTQRLWLVENKPAIRLQLLQERWHWFLSLAAEHGIHPYVVAAEFPTDTDRLDVIGPAAHTDDVLRACMATLCTDLRVKQRQQDYQVGRWVPLLTNDEVMP